ncbi:MAG: phosphoenolpyruvate kinase [Bdellovibrionota bacterium]
MTTSVTKMITGGESTRAIFDRLAQANQTFLQNRPGDFAGRHPVHTVYGGAQLFTPETVTKLGANARKALAEHAPTPDVWQSVLDVGAPLARQIHERVLAKLEREAVEDFRVDFEDGYGNRTDVEEDAQAKVAAIAAGEAHRAGKLPAFFGIRVKSFSQELAPRAARTMEIFISEFWKATQGPSSGAFSGLPSNFVVTIPKITAHEQVDAAVSLIEAIERGYQMPLGMVPIELMVETPQSIFGPRGECALPGLVARARGRCVAAHFGTYDYTASLNITAAHQQMNHPVCDFARDMMQVSLAQTGIRLSDGATNVMPVGDTRSVHAAWRLSRSHIEHSLARGFYQGWDLHPAQLPIRYATLYKFFLEGFEPASIRLKNFVEKAAQATLVGDVFDDAATGQGLLNYFIRAVGCGAVDEQDAASRTGLTLTEIKSRSFLMILNIRRGIAH